MRHLAECQIVGLAALAQAGGSFETSLAIKYSFRISPMDRINAEIGNLTEFSAAEHSKGNCGLPILTASRLDLYYQVFGTHLLEHQAIRPNYRRVFHRFFRIDTGAF
jgi:hypothetical protein